MKSFKQLNEDLWIVQDNLSINEMARIEKVIIVHTDREPGQYGDNLKFAHFHYNNIHFKFMQQCPKNITQLRQMIAFEKEQIKITDKELKNLLTILCRKPSKQNRIQTDSVYDYTIGAWEMLNERDVDYID